MATSNTIFRRLRYTPLRDVVRLRLTGRLDLETMLNESGLPAPVAACVGRVVRGTRLWRLEKSDVAHELIAHFRDGLANGASVEELLASFGDEKQAAKLIRRAKIRNRPLAWHAMRWLRRCVAALIVFYIALVIYFYTGKPTIRTDYLAKFNAAAAEVPEDQAAWPFYRQALIELKLSSPETIAVWAKAYPQYGTTRYDVLAAFIKEHEGAMNLIHRGAALPGLGFPAASPLSEKDRLALVDLFPQGLHPAFPDSPLFYKVMLQPGYLSRMRLIVRLLEAEGKTNIDAGDGGRVADDIDALLGVARHSAEQPLILNAMAAISIRSIAADLLAEVLTRRPDIFDRAQLRRLAHELSTYSAPNTSGERMLFYDWVQRGYTDNGRGDGRLTLEGVRLLSLMGDVYQFHLENHIATSEYTVLPVMLLVTASRKDMLARYDQIMDEFEAEQNKPFRDTPRGFFTDVGSLRRSTMLERVRYGTVVLLTDALGSFLRTGEQVRGTVDGVVIAIALELYRRDHGRWPTTLDVLAPGYIPKLPIDRITGGPLHYRIVNNQPMIYSVGVDRKDDGGRVPMDGNGHPARYAAQWHSFENPPTGDWVLWPLAKD